MRFSKIAALAIGAAMVHAPIAARADVPAKRIYSRLCSSCHGADGSGNPDMAATLQVEPKLLNLGRPEAAGITRDQKRETLLKGKGKMPAYDKKLKAEEVDPVLDYTIQITEALRKK